ncbi:MAG: hypothetical protein A2Y10_07140 [Planctomycetes bacterium GWF2_41_51]|nr:MAG: hypothetical protein A2Y10_07140 [Planctomycetes bacterium GWF2_41_51]HBG28760.1 hypothetical protein [Phycisphaerales bacterium]
MTCQDYKNLMMAYIDGELEAEAKKTFEEHLQSCKECSDEFKEFKQLKQHTDEIKFTEPEERIWEQYWQNVYNRTERATGWILFSIASILLLAYGGFKAIEAIIRDPSVGLILKAALLILIAGAAVLFVSVLRERIYFWKNDRYKDVRR